MRGYGAETNGRIDCYKAEEEDCGASVSELDNREQGKCIRLRNLKKGRANVAPPVSNIKMYQEPIS